MHSSVLNIVFQHTLPILSANNYSLLTFRAGLAQQIGLEMDCDHGSIDWSCKQNVPIKAPTQISDTHFERIHQNYQRFLQLWFPDSDCRFSGGQSNDWVTGEFLGILLFKEGGVDSWNGDWFKVTSQRCKHVPICAVDKWRQIVRPSFASSGCDKSAIWRPGKSPK